MYKKINILLTNDDGIDAVGIKCIFDVLKEKYDITIVAPNIEKSGVSHSITYRKPLFYDKIENSYAKKMYKVNGSPADCIKIGLNKIMQNKPAVIVSGLNIGDNSGISSHYSGTVAAARESMFCKLNSFAFSICEKGKKYCKQYSTIIPEIINRFSFNKKLLLNVNFPSCSLDCCKGVKITKQSLAFFNDSYREEKIDGKVGFKLFGNKINIEENEEYDTRALLNNWITITPLSIDATAYKDINDLKCIENSFIKGSINVR